MPKPMAFGTGADFSFGVELPSSPLPAGGSGAGAIPSLSKDVFPPPPPDSVDRSLLAKWAATPTKKLEEERLRLLEVSKPPHSPSLMEDDNWDRAVALEIENKDLNRKNAAFKNDNANLEKELREAKYQLKESEDQLRQVTAKVQVLETQTKQAVGDLADEKAAALDATATIDRLYAELQQAHTARDNAFKERDDVLSGQYLLKRELEDMTSQWRDLDGKNNDLIEELEAAQEIADSTAELENDLKKLRDEHMDQDREIVVKNERIDNLEQQIQKANKRLLEMADEKARAAAASPTDDNRHIGSLGDSLEDELSGLDNESYYEPEWNTYSNITSVSTAPIEPVRAEPSTIHAQEAASVAPVEPVRAPASKITQYDATSVAPIAARSPTQTFHFGDAASTTPIKPATPSFTLFQQDAASSAPREPAKFSFSFSQQATASVAPVEPLRPTPSTITEHEIASVAPVEPKPALSTISEHEIASFAPREPKRTPSTFSELHISNVVEPIEPVRAPPSTITEYKVADFAPGAPTPARLTITEHEIASFAPVEPVRPLSTITEYKVAEFAPIEPKRPISTITEYEVADFPPVRPRAPILSLMIEEAASTSPIARQIITTSDFATQTIEPKPTRTTATQTRAIPPPKPKVPESRIGPVMVTHEVKPVEQVVPKPVRTRSTGVQTPIVIPKNAARKKTTMDNLINYILKLQQKNDENEKKTIIRSGTSPLTWFFAILDVILAIYLFYVVAELSAWQEANGYGFGNGEGNALTRGADVHGRLVGLEPESSWWWSGEVASMVAKAGAWFEDWAGVGYEVYY